MASPREPSQEEVLDFFANNTKGIPSFYLLDPAKNFHNEERAQFLELGAPYLEHLFFSLLERLDFSSAPKEITEAFRTPGKGPAAIVVGGSAMTFLDKIPVRSTDIDIDILPLSSSEGVLLPAYTSEQRLTPLYQQYFDWIQERVIELLEMRFIGSDAAPGSTDMVPANIDQNIEVSRSRSYDRRLRGIPGEVRSVRVVGRQRYVVAQIINQSFYSKVAVWIRRGEELERIVELKLVTEFPQGLDTKFVPIDARGSIVKPTLGRFLESAFQTLDYRIEMLQKDADAYNKIIKGLLVVPDTDYLEREEVLRKKLLASKMRVEDLFQRIYYLFMGSPVDMTTYTLFISYCLVIAKKKNEYFMNPYMIRKLSEFSVETFSVFSRLPSFTGIAWTVEQKRLEVFADFETAKSDESRMPEPVKNLNSFRGDLKEAQALRETYKARARDERMKALKRAETASAEAEAEADVDPELAAALAASLEEGSEPRSSVSPLSGEDSDDRNSVDQQEREEQLRVDAEEVLAVAESLQEGKEDEASQRKVLKNLLKRQKEEKEELERVEKEKRRQQRIAASLERNRLASVRAEKRREEKKKKAEEEAAAIERAIAEVEAEKEQEEYKKERERLAEEKRQKFRDSHRILFISEPLNFKPQYFFHDVFNTFYRQFYPRDPKGKEGKLIIGFRIMDYLLTMDRSSYLGEGEKIYPPNFTVLKEHLTAYYYFVCQESMLPIFIALYSDMPIPPLVDALLTAVRMLLKFDLPSKTKLARIEKELTELLGEFTQKHSKTDEEYTAAIGKFYTEIQKEGKDGMKHLFSMMTVFEDESMPKGPTSEDFDSVYTKLFSFPFVPISEDASTERKSLYNDTYPFYKDVLVNYYMYYILEAMKLKNKVVGVTKPLLVMCPFPSPYRNSIVYGRGIKAKQFSFTWELFKKLHEVGFLFQEAYPFTEEYLKLKPSFQSDIDRIVGGQPFVENRSQLVLLSKQVIEYNLYFTQTIWKNEKPLNLEKFDIVLNSLAEQKYYLNSDEDWKKLVSYINDEKLTVADLQAITLIMIEHYKKFFSDRFGLGAPVREKVIEDLQKQIREIDEIVSFMKSTNKQLKKLKPENQNKDTRIVELVKEKAYLTKTMEGFQRSLFVQTRFPFAMSLQITRQSAEKDITKYLASKGLKGGRRRRTRRRQARRSTRKTRVNRR